MPYTQLNNLDFADIKAALREYMRSQSDFIDYDFEASALSQLLDVLAYNTYYTAFNTNMVVNELFLDSATLRDNVVALAKQLGYNPKSTTSPMAVVDTTITFTGTAPAAVIFKAGSGFVTNYDGSLYRFVLSADRRAEVINGVATFADIEIYEGSLITTRTTVDTTLKDQRFLINNPSADLTTLKVRVFQSANSSVYEEYEVADNILDIGSEDKIYFVNEIEDETYEIFFGDGFIGKKLDNNQVIEMSYIVTNGVATNGARTFNFNGQLTDADGFTINVPFNINVNTISNANGGAEIESISKIKFNAPKFYGSQNRAVTANDYSAIVRNLYPSISDIIVFGGEDQEPPAYGKVFIAVKPSEAASLSSYTKNELKKSLKKYTIASIQPEFIDPSILYIEISSEIFYDGVKTILLPAQVAAKALLQLQNIYKHH